MSDPQLLQQQPSLEEERRSPRAGAESNHILPVLPNLSAHDRSVAAATPSNPPPSSDLLHSLSTHTNDSSLPSTTLHSQGLLADDDDEPDPFFEAAESGAPPAQPPLHATEPTTTNTHSTDVPNFITEHRLFLQAVLDLLAERDRHAPAVGMNDPFILKAGSLKKASRHGVWKVKYVEVRRGMFTYYDQGTVKNIPLEAQHCQWRPVKLHQKALHLSQGGAMFELTTTTSTTTRRRLWMAASKDERQTWKQVLETAMVGGSVTRGTELQRSSDDDNNDPKRYFKLQASLKHAKHKNDYVGPLLDVFQDGPLHIPIKAIVRQQLEGAFVEHSLQTSVHQLWRDLQRDSLQINHGPILQGQPERMLGGLTKQLLCHHTSASQAFSYARDVLLAGNRTRSGGDSYYAVSTLLQNSDLVVVVPKAAEADPVSIHVVEDPSNGKPEKSGWIQTRSKLAMSVVWKKYYFVLSEGTLSYYEGALPRPHRLKGQLVLHDAKLSIAKRNRKKEDEDDEKKPFYHYEMLIATRDPMKDRVLLFRNADHLLDWTYALECTAKAGGDGLRGLLLRRRSSVDDTQSRLEKVDSTSPQILAEQATLEHATALGFDLSYVEERLAMYAKRTTSSAKVSIHARTEYNICTTDPQGDESEDTWATLQTDFMQTFRIIGGPNGRMIRGEEFVRISLAGWSPPISPGSPSRRMRKNRLFRSSSTPLNDTTLEGCEEGS